MSFLQHIFIFLPISLSLLRNSAAETKGGGVVLFRRIKYNNSKVESMQFLLLKSRLSSYNFAWLNLNVHCRVGQNQQDRALHELKIRTGVGPEDVRIVPNFVKRIHIKNKFGREKNVAFYFAEIINPDQDLSLARHHYDGYRWVTLKEAARLGLYPNQLELLRLCDYYLKKVNLKARTEEVPLTKPTPPDIF